MPHSRVLIQLGEVTNSCFVAMPFHPLYDKQYDSVIKPAVEAAGLTCVRGDEIYAQQSIVQDIWLYLRGARLVIAELSGRNPNVMYEVGLAHALGKSIILLTRNEDDVPFDLKALRYVYYDTNNPDWGADLRNEITRAVTRVLERPSLAAHLNDVKVETPLPAAPLQPIAPAQSAESPLDLSGVWQGTWLSIQLEREHRATLVIPTEHGTVFTASMTIVYERSGQQTIVEETLTATIVDRALALIGVNYTYVQKGASSSYSLDNFNLKVAEDGRSLAGKAVLRHGVREISFARVHCGTTQAPMVFRETSFRETS